MFGYMTLQIYIIILEGFHVKLGVDRSTWGSSQEISVSILIPMLRVDFEN